MKKKKINITKQTASSYLPLLVDRAIETVFMSKESMPYHVVNMAVFGSYLSDKRKLGDLDILVEKRCKWENRGEMVEYFQYRNNKRTDLERLGYHETVFYRHLIENNHAISIHDMHDLEYMQSENKDFKYEVFCTKIDMIDIIKNRINGMNRLQECLNKQECCSEEVQYRTENLKTALSILENFENIQETILNPIENKMEQITV